MINDLLNINIWMIILIKLKRMQHTPLSSMEFFLICLFKNLKSEVFKL